MAATPEIRTRSGATLGAWIVRVLLLFVVMTIAASLIYYVRRPSSQKRSSTQITEDYVRELGQASSERCTAGHFQVPLPREWAKFENNFSVSIESTDKRIAVDYVRDPRLSGASVRAIFAAGGHEIAKSARGKSGDVPIEWYVARGGDRASLAVLHIPANAVPALALLIAPTDVFLKLPDEVIATLCITGFKLQDLPMSAVTRLPAPPLSPGVPAISPKPGAKPTAIPVAGATPEVSPVSAAKGPLPSPASTPPRVTSSRLGITLELPADWKGTTDEQEGIVKLESADKINVSIGRDAKPLDPREVFDAMKDEGWTVVAINQSRQIPGTSRSVAVADMTKGDTRLRLYLLDQPDAATMIVYAVHDGKLKPEQWTPLTQIVGQIAAQTDTAAPRPSGTRD